MDDRELRERFEDLTLPFDQWTHRAHVRMAYIYLTAYLLPEAEERIRRGIKAYNAHNGLPEGPTSGYNETTTIGFARLIHAIICNYGPVMPTADSEAFCDLHTQLLSRNVLRFFYSPQRRMLPEAKVSFVEPDLTPLPGYKAKNS